MRRNFIGSLFALVALVLSSSGCTRSRTQVMIGLATDLRAKGEIDQVAFTAWKVDDQGQKEATPSVQFSWDLADVPAEVYELPGSIGIYSPNGNETRVFVLVEGRLGDQVRVTREAIFSLVREQTLFLRLTLVQRCMSNTQCVGDDVCVEGDCKAREIDSRRFPLYEAPPVGLPDPQVTQLDCVSTVQYIRTNTGEAMTTRGEGVCPPGTFCQEGVCLKELNDDLGVGKDGSVVGDLPFFPSTSMIAVTGRVETDSTITLFTAADDGTIYRQPDATATNLTRIMETRAPRIIRSLFAAPSGDVFGVGDAGLFMRRDNATGAWETQTFPDAMAMLTSINGDATGLAMCGGASFSAPTGVAYTTTFANLGNIAAASLPAMPATLHAVSASSGGHVYAVGNGRSLYLGSDGTWQQLTVPPAPQDGNFYDFYDIAGPVNGHYYAVGSQGQIMRIDEQGGVFQSVTFDTLATKVKFLTINYHDAENQWLAAGEGGEVWSKFEAQVDWVKVTTPLTDTLYDSWSTPGYIFIVGGNGAQLYRGPPVVVPDDMAPPTDL